LQGLAQTFCLTLVVSGSVLAQDGVPTSKDHPAAAASLNLTGALAHIASAGGWDTSLTLVNLGTAAGQAQLNFFGNDGSALPLPFTFPQQPASGTTVASSVSQAINPNAVLVLDTTGPSQTVAVGSAQLLTSGGISGFGIFKDLPTGQEAVVPLETRNALSYVLAFDNTGPLVTGLAIANLAGTPANVGVVIRNDAGTKIGSGAITLAAGGHNSFVLTDPTLGFPITANIRGTLEFDTPLGGRITILGLRANGNALTSLPVLANVGTTGGTMAHVASGGGWQTIFTLVNTGPTAASATVVFTDDHGNALPLPLSYPQTGATFTQTSVNETIAAGATLVVVTQGPATGITATGSAQLVTNGNISGFAIFQSGGQEAVVPMETGSSSAYTLAFDNTGGLVTGVAVANSSSQQALIPATLRDATGATLAQMNISLPPKGHMSQVLTVLFSQAANLRGTLEFDTPANGAISALGIRATPAGAFTTIPVMTPTPTGSVTAERELAQTALAVGLASTVLQSQITVLDALLGEAASCTALNGGGSVLQGAATNTSAIVGVYYDNNCSQPYISANVGQGAGGSGSTSDGLQISLAETATYYGLNGSTIGTMTLNETALDGSTAVNVWGLGIFTPVSGARTPVQLGLYCGFLASSATTPQCAGGIAQDFPSLGIAIGAVTPLALTLGSAPPLLTLGTATTGGVTFTGGGSAVTGPPGSLTLTNPNSTSLVIQGGAPYATTTASGSAATFSLFPPTPTSWMLTDSAHDQQFQIFVTDNTTRNLALSIIQVSTGQTLATGALDHSGSGSITYSDGSTAVITNWTLAD